MYACFHYATTHKQFIESVAYIYLPIIVYAIFVKCSVLQNDL